MTGKRLFLYLGFQSLLGLAVAQPRVVTLEELFQCIDAYNRNVKSGELQIRQSEAAIEVAKNDRLPSLQLSADWRYIGDGFTTDRNFSNGEPADMPHAGNSFLLKATQTVYQGGAISRNIERSKIQKKVSEDRLHKTRQDVRFLLLGHYLDIFQLSNQKKVYERNIEQTRLLVRDMEAAYRQGTALKSDITRYELQLQNVQLRLTHVQNQMDILNHQLVTSIGWPVTTVIEPDTTMLKQTAVERLPEKNWIERAQDAPQMRLARAQVDLSKNSEQLLKAGMRPHLFLKAEHEFSGPILVEVPAIDKNFGFWSAGVGLSYNIDALYRNRRKLKQNKVEQLDMQEKAALAEEELLNDIHEAYVNLDEAYVRLETQKKSVQLAHENYFIVKQRYMNGQALITDMLDASNTQLEMELELANAQIGILYQYYLLRKVAGIL